MMPSSSYGKSNRHNKSIINHISKQDLTIASSVHILIKSRPDISTMTVITLPIVTSIIKALLQTILAATSSANLNSNIRHDLADDALNIPRADVDLWNEKPINIKQCQAMNDNPGTPKHAQEYAKHGGWYFMCCTSSGVNWQEDCVLYADPLLGLTQPGDCVDLKSDGAKYHRGPFCCKNTPHTGGDFYCIRLSDSDKAGSFGRYSPEGEEVLNAEAAKRVGSVDTT